MEQTLLEEYKKLIKAIKSADIYYDDRYNLINYVEEVRDGKRNNDFFEFDFLKGVILEHLTNPDVEKWTRFQNTIKFVNQVLLPLGKESDNYENLKKLVINGFNNVDEKFYLLFENKVNCYSLIKLIRSKDFLKTTEDFIIDFAVKIKKYCMSDEDLIAVVLAFIVEFEVNRENIDEYIDSSIEELKQKSGIYGIDESKIETVYETFQKVTATLKKIELAEKRFETHKENIKKLVNDSKTMIADFSKEETKKLQTEIEAVKGNIFDTLDDYLKDLEISLKNSSDEVFNQILDDTQNKLRSIKLAAQSLSTTTTQDLLRIQKASEESVQKLRDYVENEPNLQKYLQQATESDEFKEALLKLTEKKPSAVTVEGLPSIMIPESNRIILSSKPEIELAVGDANRKLIPAFDYRIPLEERLRKVLEKKAQLESEGELFHELTEEVLIDVMTGDWVYLYGPSGCGKSYLIEQVAMLLGIELAENGKITDKYSIMAYNDPHGRFRATQTFLSLYYGKMLSYDEFDNGNTDTQVCLNDIYSALNNKIERPERDFFVTFAEDMTVPVNGNFRIISAGNTEGKGENELFSARGKIDESIQQRMINKFFNYDNRVEQRILINNQNWYNLFVNFREACTEYARRILNYPIAPGMITTRDAAHIKRYIADNGKSVDQVIREKFVQTKDQNYLDYIAEYIASIYHISQDCDRPMINEKLGDVEEIALARNLIYRCKNKFM